MKKNQKGIALIETLLIVLILVIIGFGGYYVWHTQKETDKANTNTLKVSQSAPANSNSQANNFFVIKEWGLKGPNSSLVHLKYTMTNTNGNQAAEFTSTELVSAGGSDCSTAGGTIIQYNGSDTTALNVSNSNETIEQAAANGEIGAYSLVNNKYYVFVSPQAACGDPDKIQTAETDTLDAVKALSTGLRAQ